MPSSFSFRPGNYLRYLIWSTNARPESWRDSSAKDDTTNHYRGQWF